ncbi:MAG: DsbA family oxidoreductase [Pseudomonadota bacterium]
MVSLDVISDPICPWCYIGKANLDRAIAQAGRDPFQISWRIFQLNPEMPPEGIDRKQYLEWKFGGPDGAKQVYGRIADAGRAAGLEMNLDAIPRTPNTFDAHRLIRWAQSSGSQTAVVEDLFRKYFVEGVDISSRDTLLDIAESAGLERDVISRLFDGDADREDLTREEAAAREMGVTGVPCFIINGRHVVQGAQDTETWVRIIEELNAALDARQEDAT